METEPLVHVIDDDEAARDSLSFLIDCAGIRVRAYENAAHAITALTTLTTLEADL